MLIPPLNTMGRQILLIEDNADFREIFGRVAGHLGFDVIYAEGGLEGVRRALTEKPDLIVLDLMLAGIDGIETIRRLKRNHGTRNIPIVVCTAMIDDQSQNDALHAGAVEYLRKPIRLFVLERALRRYLD